MLRRFRMWRCFRSEGCQRATVNESMGIASERSARLRTLRYRAAATAFAPMAISAAGRRAGPGSGNPLVAEVARSAAAAVRKMPEAPAAQPVTTTRVRPEREPL